MTVEVRDFDADLLYVVESEHKRPEYHCLQDGVDQTHDDAVKEDNGIHAERRIGQVVVGLNQQINHHYACG